jgi:hypothetical protein
MRTALLLLPCSILLAAEPVSVSVRPMSFAVQKSALGEGSRGSSTPGTGYYPIRDPATKKPVFATEQRTVEVVVLDNGLVEAWVVPAWGARLIRAVDKKTGVDYFWKRTVEGQWVADDVLPWNPSGVKASFPFFEHGLGLSQPAGWRTVVRPDGSAVVAMDLRFTANASPGDLDRYGRYGDEALGVQVILRPGSTLVEWVQRKDNNNATPRSDRMWNDASFPLPVIHKEVEHTDKKTGEKSMRKVQDTAAVDRVFAFLYPARWVVNHGPTAVHASPHWSAPTNWDVSHFAIDAPYRFAGGWYANDNLNRLRINDTEAGRGPGVKLWTAPGPDFFELWGGESWVFEYPGELQAAWRPTSFSHRFWIAQGIGQADIANDHVAVGVEGTAFRMVASRDAQAVVVDATGATVASGPVGPHTVLTGSFDGKRLAVQLDGAGVLDQAFPLDRPVSAKDEAVPAPIQAMFEKLKTGAAPSGPAFFEKQCYGRNQGQPGIVNAMDAIPKHTVKGPETASLARVAYRLGELEHAERLARLAGGPEGDFVLGLIQAERGEATDFGSAGVEAAYLRALQALRRGDQAKAIELATAHVAAVPDAWYPRLALAAWKRDAAAARTLADEHPASPEAQWVLQHLGQPAEVDQALRGRADAAEHLAVFRDQVERGIYRHVPRYPLELLRKRGW